MRHAGYYSEASTDILLCHSDQIQGLLKDRSVINVVSKKATILRRHGRIALGTSCFTSAAHKENGRCETK